MLTCLLRAGTALSVGIGVMLLVAGCGKSVNYTDDDLPRIELGQVYDMYTHYLKRYERAPNGVAALQGYAPIHTAGYRVLQDGKYSVQWGVTEKSPDILLAYEKTVPQQGGAVLMADGSVKTITAEEFHSLARPAR